MKNSGHEVLLYMPTGNLFHQKAAVTKFSLAEIDIFKEKLIEVLSGNFLKNRV